MSIYSHKSKKDSLWLHFTASKIVTPLKRLAVGWKPITSTIVFMITASMGWTLLNDFINELGWEALLNTRGTTWRKLDETTRNKITDAASAAALMTEMPAIIKRPLLCAPGKPMLLGFSDSSYQQFFHEV